LPSLFSQIDNRRHRVITKTELEQAVTKAGGTTQAADALYAKLDPNNTAVSRATVLPGPVADDAASSSSPPPRRRCEQ